jgi:hypothetical protein
MKPIALTLFCLLSFFLETCSHSTAPPSGITLVPFTADSGTAALWHFDEAAGIYVEDASSHHNTGSVIGATVTAGQFGNAREFDSTSTYISVPSAPSLNMDTSSFTINVWFKTTGQPAGMLVRKGVSPVPGYHVNLSFGRVAGLIGDQQFGPYPDTTILILSDHIYSDNQWHCATFIRDRTVRQLLLYVDGVSAATPVDDVFNLSLDNDRPLTIGRWENTSYPWFYKGAIDEVRIQRGVVKP